MAGSIKGIIVEIGGDTSGLQRALSKVNSAASSLSRELKQVNSMLKLDPKNTELLKQKQDVLNNSIKNTKDKIKELEDIKAEADKQMAEGTEFNEENYRKLIREIEETKRKLVDLVNEASQWNIVGSKMQQWGDNLEKIGSKISSLGDKLTTRLTLPIAGIVGLGLKYNSEIETLTASYETFLGSAEEAEKVINQIRTDASKTPFDVTALAKANQMLISTGENAEASQKTILALGEAVVATGGGNDELTRMASNLQQIKNAGKATAMDIRQFAYAGIDVYGLLADYIGKTTEEIKGMEISYEDLSGALQKASQSGGKYYGAMEKASGTLAGQTKQLKAEFMDMLGKLTKSLMPVAKQIIAKIKEWVQKFDNLSDAQKSNIVKIGLLVAALGPLLKIFGTLTSTTGTVVKGIGTLTKAIGLMKNGVGNATGSAATLAKGLTGLISPAGAATVAIAAVAAAVLLIKNSVDKEFESTKKLSEELKENEKARKDALQTINDQMNTNLAEINYTKELSNELDTLVDANGRVKEGYEARAKFILGQLNEALGTEYEMNGNLIEQYDTLKQEIDDLILKKKAQIILEANEEAFKEAYNGKQKLYEDYLKTQDELNKATAEYSELLEDEKKIRYQGVVSLTKEYFRKKALAEQIVSLTDTYNEQKETLAQYQLEIERFETNSQLMVEGGAENYKKIELSMLQTTDNITNNVNEGLAKQLQAQIDYNNKAKREYTLEMQYNKNAKDSIYAENYKSSQENLQLLIDDLIARTSTVDKLGKEEIAAWTLLGETSYEEYNEALSKMPEAMKNKIISMTKIATNDTTVFEATSKLANDANKGFNDNVDGFKWGTDLVSLLSKGINNPQSQEKLRNAANTAAKIINDRLHFSVPDEGPLSDMDKAMPDMIDLMVKGIENNKNKLIYSVSSLASTIKKSLNLNNNVLSDQTLKNNMIFTTPNIVFNVQKMDEANLDTAFRYVNRRLGSQY